MGKVKIEWSPKFAYAIGLLVTDGCLVSDGRHISFTSKDLELINNFQKGLSVHYYIGRKASGSQEIKKYYTVQFSDVQFYNFLLTIGLTPRKTMTISNIKIPTQYFFDFLRGHFDGDGTFYSYWDLRWKSSFMFYTAFVSASKTHIDWLRDMVLGTLGIRGHITKSINSSIYQLKYAKAESLKLFPKLYYDEGVVCLGRKRRKIEKAFRINSKHIN